ncbi:hypothetical protein CLV63_1471 [Murinocardiopsis flavida]|uniref:Homeodomain-like domain-containing protein n=1 Tax=Murinocardiopsis flavida TaxID=645275 RepID=A0A2P8C8U6_9ACTN|nr:hypothetical protein [Murinocardiopsis flavida]PSK81385.1 hypothetical protein CLV63_1471 [Murinocardiopsis flavida]
MDAVQLAAAASDTSTPVHGLRSVASLRALVESLELRQVEEALRLGESWSTIAAALGVTRQAVHKKYAKRLSHVDPIERGQ